MANETYLGDNSPSGIIIRAQSGVQIASTTSDKVGFYGATPVAQLTASSYATSNVGTASSTDVTTGTKAGLIAVMNTLSGLGIWPTQA
jgi:hypothetical protein